MDGAQATLLACAGALALVMVTLCARTGKPVRAFCGTALPGVISLAAINYASFFTGVNLLINAFTIFTAVFLGLPGIISIFILKLLWRV